MSDLWWLAGPDGLPRGPYARAELESAAVEQGLGAEARVWREGRHAWRPLSSLHGDGRDGAAVWLRLAWPLALAAFAVAATTCALLVWSRVDRWMTAETLVLAWPAAGWSLLTLSVLGPALWITAARRAAGAPELRALGTVLAAIAAVCGGALGLFQLHLERPAVDTAIAQKWLGYDIKVDEGARRIVVVGSIGPDFGRRFEAALARVGNPVTVDISSDGGLVDEAMRAARALELRPDAAVATRKVCASACLILLMAGNDRTADADMFLDIHATGALVPTKNRLVTWSAANAGDESDAFLRERGMPAELVDAANKAGGGKVLSLSPVAALEAGILTAVTHRGLRYGPDRIHELPRRPARQLRPASEPPSPWDD